MVSFVSIVRFLPHTGFLLSFIHNMVETKERQNKDKTYNNHFIHPHIVLIIAIANFLKLYKLLIKLTLTLLDAKTNQPYFLGCSRAFTLSFRVVELCSRLDT